MRHTASLFLVLVFCAIPISTFAAGPSNYALVKAGIYSPQASDLDGFDTGFNGEFALGHYFNPNIALEAGIGYFETKGDETAGGVSASAKIKTVPFTLTGKFLYPMGQFEPYAEAGLGLYYVKADVSVSAPGLFLSGSDSDTVLGWHLGLGGNFYITPEIFAGIEGRYLWAKPSFNGVDVKIDGYTATALLGVRF